MSRAESSLDEVLTDDKPDLEENPQTDDLEEYPSAESGGEDHDNKDLEWNLKKRLRIRTVETKKKRTLQNPKILYGRNGTYSKIRQSL